MSERETLDSESGFTAAELALGLLEGDAVRQALRRQANDPVFAADVLRWQRHADGWLEQLAGEDPNPSLLTQIERELDRNAGRAKIAQTGGSIKWRARALTSIAASVVLAIGLVLSLVGDRRTVIRPSAFAGNVTQISDAQGAPLLSAVFESGQDRLLLRRAALGAPGKVPELWVIPAGGAPRSLGLIGSDKLVIEVAPELRALLVDGATLAITLESPAGAPHAAPTGKILGTGKLQSI